VKKLLTIFLLFVLIAILILKFVSKQSVNKDTLLCRISNVLNRNNSIELNCTGIDKTDINITWNSLDLNNRIVIKEGVSNSKIGHVYGTNIFRILYKGVYMFDVSHFKTNNWHAHKYKIDINRDSTGYLIRFVADGPNYTNTEQHYNHKGILNGLDTSFDEYGNVLFTQEYINGELKHSDEPIYQSTNDSFHKNFFLRIRNGVIVDLYGWDVIKNDTVYFKSSGRFRYNSVGNINVRFDDYMFSKVPVNIGNLNNFKEDRTLKYTSDLMYSSFSGKRTDSGSYKFSAVKLQYDSNFDEFIFKRVEIDE
jgi:hypothetical protein